MQRGEVCTLLCKPEYAYGSAGNPDKIPPNASVLFEVGVFCHCAAWRMPPPLFLDAHLPDNKMEALILFYEAAVKEQDRDVQ